MTSSTSSAAFNTLLVYSIIFKKMKNTSKASVLGLLARCCCCVIIWCYSLTCFHSSASNSTLVLFPLFLYQFYWIVVVWLLFNSLPRDNFKIMKFIHQFVSFMKISIFFPISGHPRKIFSWFSSLQCIKKYHSAKACGWKKRLKLSDCWVIAWSKAKGKIDSHPAKLRHSCSISKQIFFLPFYALLDVENVENVENWKTHSSLRHFFFLSILVMDITHVFSWVWKMSGSMHNSSKSF